MRKKQISWMCVISLLAGSCLMPVQNTVWADSKKPALSKKKVSVKKGKTIKLSVKRAKGFQIKWKSKNKKIALVKKSGKYGAKVTAKKRGKTQILAQLKKGKKRYTLKSYITVTETAKPSNVPEQPDGPINPGVTANPSVAGTTVPPIGETAAPPAGETSTPPAGETSTPPAGETSTPPAGETSEPPAGETVKPPIGEPSTPPATEKPVVTTAPTMKPTAKPTVNPTVKPTAKPATEAPTVKPTAVPASVPPTQVTTKPALDLTKNMASEAEVLRSAETIKASVGENGAVAELTGASRYNQVDYKLNDSIPLNTIGKVEYSLQVTGTPDNVSFKLYDSEGKELTKITQYNKKTGTYTIEIPEEYQSLTISQFSIMTNTGLADGATQTATAVLSSLLFVPASQVTPTPEPTPVKTPVPTARPTLPPSSEEDGVKMLLNAEMRLTNGSLEGDPVYHHEDGSVTVSIKKQYGGGGIGFYLDPSKTSVDLSEYSKIVFDISAEAEGPVCLNQYAGTDFYTYKTLANVNVNQERQQLSADLWNEDALGFGVRYAAWSGSAVEDPLTITIHSITLIKDTRDISDALNNYSSLFELAASYGFKMGTVYNTKTATDKKYGELMKYHFNSMTAANEMKAYSMLNEADSKKKYVDENSMPAINFENADIIMDFAKENGIKVRGHVLVWDADMCDWFFREGYDTNKGYASKEVVTARLKNYIEQVLVHFEQKYPGVIYCWDVVNEAVSDGAGEHKDGDARMVRTTRDGKVNRFYEILGDHYVEDTFKYTYEIIQEQKGTYPGLADIKLYYNDFSTFYPTKRDAICELVKSINQTLPDSKGGYVKLCDGVGMQSYIGGFGQQPGCMDDNDISRVKAAIEKFADCGVEIQVTELAVRNYQGDEATLQTHGEFYKKLFQTYIDINKERTDKPLKAVSIWGIVDRPDMAESDYSYRMNGTYCGLFDEKLGVKPSFVKVHDLMKGTAE